MAINFFYRTTTGTLEKVSNNLNRELSFESAPNVCPNNYTIQDRRCPTWQRDYRKVLSVTTKNGQKVIFGNKLVGSSVRFAVWHSATGLAPSDPAETYEYQMGAGVQSGGLSLIFQKSSLTIPALTVTYNLNAGFLEGRVTSLTNAVGKTWNYELSGDRGVVIDPLYARTTTYHTPSGQARATKDALNWLGLNTYNDLGQLTETRQVLESDFIANPNAFRRRATFSYDANNAQVCAAQHNFGDLSSCKTGGMPATALITRTEYIDTNFPRKPTRKIRPGGGVENFTYDANGQLLHSDGPATVDNSYGAFGLLSSTASTLGILSLGSSTIASSTASYGGYINGLPGTISTSGTGIAALTTTLSWSPEGNLDSVITPKGNITTAGYDAARRVTGVIAGVNNPAVKVTTANIYVNDVLKTVREGSGLVANPSPGTSAHWFDTVMDYDDALRPISITDPSGDKQIFTYNGAGRLKRATTTSSTGLVIQTTDTLYNARGDVVGEISGAGTANAIRRHESTYALPGERTRLRQAKGLKVNTGAANDNSLYDTTWTYDAFGRVSTITFPDNSTEISTYDLDGNVTALRKRNGDVISSTYDPYGRILTKIATGTASSSQSFSYNASGMVLGTTKTAGGVSEAIALSYDGLGRMVQHMSTVTPSGGTAVSYTQDFGFDADGQVVSVDYQACRSGACVSTGASGIQYVYDALGRKISTSFPGGLAVWQYANNSSRLAGRHYGGASASTSALSMLYTYKNDGDMVQLSYDLASLTNPVTFDFINDGAGRLIQETISDPSWMWKPSTARTVTYNATNTLDQLTAMTRIEGTTAPEVTDLCYDASGNLSGTSTAGACASAPTRTYTHDANNRMTGASDTITAMSASYVYGAEESRIYKQSGSSGTRFGMNGNQVLGEHPGIAGSALGSWRLYVPGLGLDDRVAMVDMSGSSATAVHYYATNRLGSVIGMVGGTGANFGVLTDQYLYSPYGVEEPLTGSGNPFRYTGRYYDGETGLYYYRSRYYSAGNTAGGGRFLEPDSIMYKGGLNLYAYTGGDPINNVDPLGEFGCMLRCGAYSVALANAIIANPVAAIHTGLDAAGLVPAVGVVPDILNAGIYAAQGDGLNAGISLAAAVPVVGQAAGIGRLGFKVVGKFTKIENVTRKGARFQNIEAGLTKSKLEANLLADGFEKTTVQTADGPINNLIKGDKKFSTRDFSKSTDGPSVDVSINGKHRAKIRLEDEP